MSVASSWPVAHANDAVGEARTTKNTKAAFTEVLDMGKFHQASLERRMREVDVGPQSAETIGLIEF